MKEIGLTVENTIDNKKLNRKIKLTLTHRKITTRASTQEERRQRSKRMKKYWVERKITADNSEIKFEDNSTD